MGCAAMLNLLCVSVHMHAMRNESIKGKLQRKLINECQIEKCFNNSFNSSIMFTLSFWYKIDNPWASFPSLFKHNIAFIILLLTQKLKK